MNWNNNDFYWLKEQCPLNIKYWKKGSQLEAFIEANADLTTFPAKLIQALESDADANDACVSFTANTKVGGKWNENLCTGRRIIEEIKTKFIYAKDYAKRISHEVTYIDRKIKGFKRDDELTK